MPYSNQQFFGFQPNFNFAVDSVFTQIDHELKAPFPPVVGNFLLLDNSNFLLLDGTNLTLL